MNRRGFLAILGAAGLLCGAMPAQAAAGAIPGFDEAMKAGGPAMIHVTAPWCPTCKIQRPIVAALLAAPDFKAMRKFDVDFDGEKDVLRHFGVQSQSTIIVFKGGAEVGRATGETDPAAIEALLRKAL